LVSPGRIVNDDIIDVQQGATTIFQCRRNYHYSYKVITSEHKFLVTTESLRAFRTGHKKSNTLFSPIFKEVNWYRLADSDKF